MLKRNHPEKGDEYIAQFQQKEKTEALSQRKQNIAYLKEKGIRVFPNYKDETIQRMVDEDKIQEKNPEEVTA